MNKSKRIIAILLAIGLGGLGVHRFYLGQIGLGFLYLVFCWTYIPGIIAIIDAIRWAFTSNEEFAKRYN